MALNRMHEDWEKEAPKLAGIERTNPFSVPDDYFAILSSAIQTAAKAEELKDQVKTDGFSVPAGYFENLEKRIANRITTEDLTEHKPVVRRLKLGWVQYAAAACLLIAVSFGILITNQNNKIERQLHGIPETEIVQYLQLNSDASDTPVIIENLSSDLEFLHIEASEKELEEYINLTTL